MKIPNATPYSYNLGAKDVSGATPTPQKRDLPSLISKFFLFTQKGKAGRNELVVGDARTQIFGTDTFDPLSPYYNHATAFANAANGAGAPTCVERLIAPDAAPPAAFRLSFDMLATQVQDFKRNIDGTYQIGEDGNKTPQGDKVAGILGKWVVTAIPITEANTLDFGTATVKKGTQLDQTNATQSDLIPVMDFALSSQGDWGNNKGISIWANTQASDAGIDTRLLEDQLAYPFNIAVRTRTDSLSSATTEPTFAGSSGVTFVLKPGLVDRNNRAKMHLADNFVKAYQNIKDPSVTPTYASFDQIKVYDTNVKLILDAMYAAEKPLADNFSDIDGTTANEQYRLNPFSCQSSHGVPYHAVQILTGVEGSTRMVETATIWARGGSDGTMDDATFNTLIKAKYLEYGDKNSVRQDSVNYPENCFWDSGLSTDAKMAMPALISVRKGIFVHATTFQVGGPDMTDEQERSLSMALTTAFQNYPESSTYGTAACRASVVATGGDYLDVEVGFKVPSLIDRCRAWSAYMGAGNGQWKSSAKPDVQPNNQLKSVANINVGFRAAGARYLDWDAGMVWPDPYTMGTFYWPAHQTVYNDDTSVLNNAINSFALTTLWAIGEWAHKQVTGRSDLTDDQMAAEINSVIRDETEDVYDRRYIIIPETTYSVDDTNRNYSWTTVIKIGMNAGKTVQSLTVETYRYKDLAQ